MNQSILKSLIYIRNTAGNATLSHFVEDHEPVGPWLWRDVTAAGFAEVNAQGKVALTPAGTELLQKMGR